MWFWFKKTWDWLTPPPPPQFGQNPKFFQTFDLKAPLINYGHFEAITWVQRLGHGQGGRNWRASGDRQISLNASAKRTFAILATKNTVFYNFAT